MNKPSRGMPESPQHKVQWWAWVLLAALLIGLGYWILRQPYALFIIVTLGVIGGIGSVFDRRRRRNLAASRKGENICDFARSFDRHEADTWILRAVYDELSRYISVDNRPIPVRPGDRCNEDLGIDLEDLDDLAEDIAFRAGRSMVGYENNPLFGKVHTVANLVAFFENQPRLVEQVVDGKPPQAPQPPR